MKKAILLAASILIILFAWFKLAREFATVRSKAGQSACVGYLVWIKQLKEQWASEHPNDRTTEPTAFDLCGEKWRNKKLSCPGGGVYKIGRVGENPICSLGGSEHTLPQETSER